MNNLDNDKDHHDRLLSKYEKEEIRDRLVQYMELKPLRKHAGAFEREVAPRAFLNFPYKFASMFLVIAFLGSGMVFASEQSLPGDILYPVKLTVNENVREVFALTPQAKAELQLKFLNRRLEEAQLLAAEDKLDEETTAYIKTQIAKHAFNEQNEFAKSQQDQGSKDPEVIALKIEGMLRAHEEALNDLVRQEVVEVIEVAVEQDPDLSLTATGTASTSEEVEVTPIVPHDELPEVTSASERKTRDRMNFAEKEAARTALFVAEHEDVLSDDEMDELELEIDLMDDLIESGEEDFTKGSFLIASRKFKYVIILSEEVRSSTLIYSHMEEQIDEDTEEEQDTDTGTTTDNAPTSTEASTTTSDIEDSLVSTSSASSTE